MKKILVVSLLVIVSSAIFLYQLFDDKVQFQDMHSLNVYVPFVFSGAIDPRSVYTVGDQIVSEHLFAFHNATSIKKSIQPVFSEIKILKDENKVEIKPIRTVTNSTGEKLTLEMICESLKTSFSGTQHTRYSSLMKKIECVDNKVSIQMSSIPVNFEYWLRSIDFAIYEKEKLPLTNSNIQSTTGPYSLVSVNPFKVELKKNKYYPAELVANKVESVNFVSYSPSNIRDLIDQSDFHLAYSYGYAVEKDLLESLKTKGFKVQIFPNEWLVYLGFHKHVDFELRQDIGAKIDSLRSEILERMVLGSPAYSTIPSDRAYGLNESEYLQTIKDNKTVITAKRLTLATLDEWSEIPLFKFIIQRLSNSMKLEVKLFSRKEMSKIYSSDMADFFLTPMGISEADPLGNYSFLMYQEIFKEVINENMIVELYKEANQQNFNKRVKEIEVELLKKRIFVPVGHFPGIVIESSKLSRDEHKSWDWGIQTWAYKIN